MGPPPPFVGLLWSYFFVCQEFPVLIFLPCAFHWESESMSLAFIHRNKKPCFSLPGIPVPVSEFFIHVPDPKNARYPVPAKIPGTGSVQPLVLKVVWMSKITTISRRPRTGFQGKEPEVAPMVFHPSVGSWLDTGAFRKNVKRKMRTIRSLFH